MLVVKEDDPNALTLACRYLNAGRIIAFATDTTYGLAVDAAHFAAIESLYKIKKRDEKKPFAIFVKTLATAKKIFFFDETAEKIARKFFPGKLTMVLKKRPESALIIAANLNKNNDEFLGFRILNHKFTRSLLRKFDGILAVTSANISNEESARSPEQVEKYFAYSELGLLIFGETFKKSAHSTVVKISDNQLTILRHGALNLGDALTSSQH